MLVVTIFAARWIVQRQSLPPSAAIRLATGMVALALLVLTEFTVVLWLRGLTIDEYVASRDPVSGSVYLVSLGAFAVMPMLVFREPRR